MTTRVVVVGAGGFGRETIATLQASGSSVPNIVVVDDGPSETDLDILERLGTPFAGSVRQWLEASQPEDRFIIAIGNPNTRAAIHDRIGSAHEAFEPVIHPTATIGPLSTIQHGTVICAGAHVSVNVHMGMHVHVNPGAVIGHDTTLGNYVSVNPRATVSGNARVDDQVLVGSGATILQGLTIGRNAVVGAAACVTKSLPPDVRAKGVPARW